MITKRGFVKKTALDEYDSNRKGGIIAIGLRDDDELIEVAITEENDNIILGTKNGMCIKFSESDVRPMGRGASGVTGIKLKGDDYVIGGNVCNDSSMLLTVTENGYGKKTDINEFKCQLRGGKGVGSYKITEKTGLIAGFTTIENDEDVMMITSDGVVIRTGADEISMFGRVTQGVRVMKLAENVKVVSIARAKKEDEEEDKQDMTTESTSEN